MHFFVHDRKVDYLHVRVSHQTEQDYLHVTFVRRLDLPVSWSKLIDELAARTDGWRIRLQCA